MDDNTTMKGTINDSTGNFDEEVMSSYMTYQVATVIHKYGFIVLMPFGFTGNVLSLCVMLKPNNRRLSTCIYMSAIAINDNVMLALGLWHFFIVGLKVLSWNIWTCRVAGYLSLVIALQGSYQVNTQLIVILIK